MTVFIIMVTLFVLCIAASLVFKTLELIFSLLNQIVRFLDWFVEMAGSLGLLTLDITKESTCWARRLGLFYGFLILQKTKLSMRLNSTTRFY